MQSILNNEPAPSPWTSKKLWENQICMSDLDTAHKQFKTQAITCFRANEYWSDYSKQKCQQSTIQRWKILWNEMNQGNYPYGNNLFKLLDLQAHGNYDSIY